MNVTGPTARTLRTVTCGDFFFSHLGTIIHLMDKIQFSETPWSVEVDSIFTELETSPQGLSEREALRRLKMYGKNIFHTQERQGALAIFLKQLTSPLVFILIAAAVITTVLQEWTEVAVITL